MLRKFLRKNALKSWASELFELNAWYNDFPMDKKADFFIYAVTRRAGLQIEGVLTIPGLGKNLFPDLTGHVPMMYQLEKVISTMKERNQYAEAMCLSIWLHTLRSFVYPELRPAVDKLWGSIMPTKTFWRQMLKHHYDLDIADGVKSKLLNDSYKLSVDILRTLPPRYNY